jgi:hypothetical protein
MFLYILIFKLLASKMEGKGFSVDRSQAFPDLKLFLISLRLYF